MLALKSGGTAGFIAGSTSLLFFPLFLAVFGAGRKPK